MNGGLLGYFNLLEWWRTSFTREERSTVRAQVARPLSAFSDLDSGNVSWCSYKNGCVALCALATWFTRSDLLAIGRKFAERGEELLGQIEDAKDLHFALCDLINFWAWAGVGNKKREIALCRKQVALALIVAPLLRGDSPKGTRLFHPGIARLIQVLDGENDAAELIIIRKVAEEAGWKIECS